MFTKKSATGHIISNVRKPLSFKVGKYFTLGEAIKTAHRDIDNYPSDDIIINIQATATYLMDKIRDHYYTEKGWYLTPSSWYRGPALNKRIRGSTNSQHMYGMAVDFDYESRGYTVEALFKDIVFGFGPKIKLEYDQIIYDCDKYGNKWIHISYNHGRNRKRITEAYVVKILGIKIVRYKHYTIEEARRRWGVTN